MERLESMASTQRQNMMLRIENEKLHKVSSELLKQKQELENKQETLSAQLSDNTMKITILNGEVTTRHRENELLKQKLEQIAKTHDVALQADLEQCKSRLSRMEAELKTAGEQAVQAEQQKIAAEANAADLDLKHKEVSAKFSQTRQLAIKFRTELTEEKKKTSQLSAEIASLKCNLSTGESSGDKSSGTAKQDDLQFVVASLNERLNDLEEEKKKLEVDLASKLAENDEVKFRLNLLTPTVEKATARVAKLTEERDAMKERIAKLEAELISKSLPPPVSVPLTSMVSNTSNSERADLEQCKSRLSRMEAELKTAGEQAVQAEQQKIAAEANAADLDLKHKEVSAKFSQTRQLAIKFRTELTEEKKKTSQLSAEIASLKCNLSTGESSGDKSSGTAKQDDLQFVVASLNERLNDLEEEKKKLEVDLASKLAENDEVKFRLNLLTPTVEKATARVAKLTEERDAMKERIAKLEAELISKSLPPPVSVPLTSMVSNTSNSERIVLDSANPMSASTPKRIAFDSPVRSIPITTSRVPIPQVSQPNIQGAPVAVASYPAVPKLFKTTSVLVPQTSSPPVKSNDSINTAIPTEISTPQSVTFSLATSSAAPRISPGQSLFGKSAPVPATNVTTSSSANTTREELTDQAVVTEAEQSSQVSGSVETAADEAVDDDGMAQNDSAGESRDSTAGMPVSSSDGSRKRPAPDVEASDAKRQRDSPSEIVTSSEERKDIQRGTLELHPEDDINEVVELDEPDVVEDNDVEEIDDGVEQEPLSDEDVSEHDIEEFEDDEGDDDEEEGGANDADGGDDEVVVLSGESDEEEDVGEIEEDDDGGNDDEVLGADENLQSQPSLEDQDREAASAVEEADDEGRESASRPSTATSTPAPSDVPRLRIPIVYDRDDQCSSSNETGAVPQRLGLPIQRQTARRARPVRAIYQRGATRGRGNGRGQ